MEHDDTLLTIAEIAIALAGFASLISVIGRRSSNAARATGSLRLRLMLEVSFRNAAFALLPLPFVEVAPSDPMIWRIFSGLYLVVTTVHVASRLRTGDAHAERSLRPVSMRSTTLNSWGGRMKRSVLPTPGSTAPSAVAQVSSVRTDVLPTPTTRPPAARVDATEAATWDESV